MPDRFLLRVGNLQWLQLALWERHRVRALRLTLAQVAQRGALDAQGRLSTDGCVIAVAYFRAGYSPDDYPSDAEWQARRARAQRCSKR